MKDMPQKFEELTGPLVSEASLSLDGDGAGDDRRTAAANADWRLEVRGWWLWRFAGGDGDEQQLLCCLFLPQDLSAVTS